MSCNLKYLKIKAVFSPVYLVPTLPAVGRYKDFQLRLMSAILKTDENTRAQTTCITLGHGPTDNKCSTEKILYSSFSTKEH